MRSFRMKEFEQMEMQFFITPGEDEKYFEYWKKQRMSWYVNTLNIPREKLRFKPHEKLAHYASAAVDIEYEFPFGFKEIEGIHCRGDFDLSNHERMSKENLHVDNVATNEKYIPHVIETSCGCDRIVLMLICEFAKKEKKEEKERIIFKINHDLAPVKYAILPLMKKQELEDKALEVFKAKGLPCQIH